MIKPINIWEEKRYERMKYIGHNLVFKNWMLSVESGQALWRVLEKVLLAIVNWVITPIAILLGLLNFVYMLLPKIFIKKKV